VLGAANGLFCGLDPVVLSVLDAVVLPVLDPVVLGVLEAVVLSVLDAVALGALDAVVLLCVLGAAVLCVVCVSVLCVLGAALLCVLGAALLCVLGAALLCGLGGSLRSPPRGSVFGATVVVGGSCGQPPGPLLQFGHGGSSGTAYANPAFCVIADRPTLAATAAAPTTRFIDIPIRPLLGFGPDNGWLPSRPGGETTPPRSRGCRGGVR
jgi:hypothetical protein